MVKVLVFFCTFWFVPTVMAQATALCSSTSLIDTLTQSANAHHDIKLAKIGLKKAKNLTQWHFDYARYQTLVNLGDAVAGHEVTEIAAQVANDARADEKWQIQLTLAETTRPAEPQISIEKLVDLRQDLTLLQAQNRSVEVDLAEKLAHAQSADDFFAKQQHLAGIIAGKDILHAGLLAELSHFEVRLAEQDLSDARVSVTEAQAQLDYRIACANPLH